MKTRCRRVKHAQYTITFISDRLRANVLLKQYVLEVDLDDVRLFHESVADAIANHPGEVMPQVRVTVIDTSSPLIEVHPNHSLNELFQYVLNKS